MSLNHVGKTVNLITISGMLAPSDLLGQDGRLWREILYVSIEFSSRSCTSVPVIYTTIIFSFCLIRLRKHSQLWRKCTDEI